MCGSVREFVYIPLTIRIQVYRLGVVCKRVCVVWLGVVCKRVCVVWLVSRSPIFVYLNEGVCLWRWCVMAYVWCVRVWVCQCINSHLFFLEWLCLFMAWGCVRVYIVRVSMDILMHQFPLFFAWITVFVYGVGLCSCMLWVGVSVGVWKHSIPVYSCSCVCCGCCATWQGSLDQFEIWGGYD